MTPFIKDKDIKKDWYLINAQDAAVGRLAAFISKVLRGKNKPTYNPHIDNGDFVVVTNIDKIKFSGKKYIDKKYNLGKTKNICKGGGKHSSKQSKKTKKQSWVPKNCGQPNKNKTHLARSIGPTVTKKTVVKGLP